MMMYIYVTYNKALYTLVADRLWLLILKWSPIPKNWSNFKKKKSQHLCSKALKLRQEMLWAVQWLCGVCASAWDNTGGLLHPLCTSTGIRYLHLSICAVALITVSSLGDVIMSLCGSRWLNKFLLMTMTNNQNNFEGLEKRQQEVSTLFLVGLIFLHCGRSRHSQTPSLCLCSDVNVF